MREAGGNEITAGLEYDAFQGKSMGEYDEVNVDNRQIVTRTTWGWKLLDVTFPVTWFEILQNMTPEKIVDLAKLKTGNARKSLQNLLSQQMLGAALTATDFFGLQDICAETDPAVGNLGGIASSVVNALGENYWQAQVAGNVGAITVEKLNKTWFDCSLGRSNDYPDLLITTQALYSKLLAITEGQLQQFNHAKSMLTAELTFDHINFHGRPIIWETFCPAQNVFQINTNYVKLVMHKDAQFSFNHQSRSEKQKVDFWSINCFGALICTNRRMQGRMTGVTTS